MRALILQVLLVFPAILIAGEVIQNDIKYTYDPVYSNKIIKDVFTKPIPTGTTVYYSDFSSEKPGTIVFTDDTTGVTFLKCHLNNVVIPPGNTLIDCSTYTYRIENDGRSWKLDGQGNPEKLIDEEYWKDKGYSITPADIPAKKIYSYDDVPKAK